MVSSKQEALVYNIKLSSVGPGRVTGQDTAYEPTNVDLAMKLHYLRGVYYFKSQASNGLTTMKIKESMFLWLCHYYITCGRFRRSESGRPYIKCNDCGARFIEAQCDKTIDEWIEIMNKDGNIELEKLLVYSQVIGPELSFSPTVLIQVTRFNCGGFTVGLSWAHVLGDSFYAAEYMNTWGQFLAGHKPSPHPPVRPTNIHHSITQRTDKSDAVKRVGPVGDHWFVPNNTKMVAFSLTVTSTQLSFLQSKLRGEDDAVSVDVRPFEALCAVIWKCVAKVKIVEPNLITVVRNEQGKQQDWSLNSNSQGISSVKASFAIAEAKPMELVSLLMNKFVDEKGKIEDEMAREYGLLDLVVYGANLTFVDLTNVRFYDLNINGETPTYVSYVVDGVGEEGVVMILPQQKNVSEASNQGRVVTIILPENQVPGVKFELEKEFCVD